MTVDPIPERLRGAHSKCAIRPLSARERIEIEDQFFRKGDKVAVPSNATAVVALQTFSADDDPEECATLIEFALSILTVSGFHPVNVLATFTSGGCSAAELRYSNARAQPAATFGKLIGGAAATKWLARFLIARGKTPDRMHITADRFVRYSRGYNLADTLLDLCICLESLLDSQSEVSFRFGTCLTKIVGAKGKEAEETAKLLSHLYELRSKLAHGDPAASKMLEKIKPSLAELRKIARTILANYVLFISDHSRSEWKEHLHTLLFA
ncbi:MAG: hypothetical protein ABSC48_02460 [Terracidiphilus sp.]